MTIETYDRNADSWTSNGETMPATVRAPYTMSVLAAQQDECPPTTRSERGAQ
jgi:hypothetical protein